MKDNTNPNPEIIQHILKEGERYPNNSSLPLLIYKTVFNLSGENDADFIENIFKENDWTNSWRDDIYSYHHFHSNTHEVLGVFGGHCIVQFGGDHGITKELRKGDVVIIPAGVAHKKIAGEQFKCVGAYPGGIDYNIHFGGAGQKAAASLEIVKVPLPAKDPVFGMNGPLKMYWQEMKERQQTTDHRLLITNH